MARYHLYMYLGKIFPSKDHIERCTTLPLQRWDAALMPLPTWNVAGAVFSVATFTKIFLLHSFNSKPFSRRSTPAHSRSPTWSFSAPTRDVLTAVSEKLDTREIFWLSTNF
jgi:hypothetical protein